VELQITFPRKNFFLKGINGVFREIINHEAYGIKADCWAFGCILYAMATGAPPFEVQ